MTLELPFPVAKIELVGDASRVPSEPASSVELMTVAVRCLPFAWPTSRPYKPPSSSEESIVMSVSPASTFGVAELACWKTLRCTAALWPVLPPSTNRPAMPLLPGPVPKWLSRTVAVPATYSAVPVHVPPTVTWSSVAIGLAASIARWLFAALPIVTPTLPSVSDPLAEMPRPPPF